MADALEALSLTDIANWYDTMVASPTATRVVARTAGREQRANFLANRKESPSTIVLDEGNADYLPFKLRAEKFVSQ
jgi:hypothetical protein